ncbi:DUF2254 domain-containing protein [Pontibacillus sp. ALD_SL1]|uniref:DUF2254 domain-containing protein n=1 Tax=Pontibacillus sp. ALD_SL1 TaxID=2777185 RepID=UPI001A97BB19|nr:DUF2254 domain-containing protein [Pontibacillus sp. ALD_SL1]QST00247.1 DUF2254 domain-containing protein [Pontibacillus sp. ALD_SL1]
MKIIPPGIRKYLEMSQRLRKHELKLTLWFTPAIYILGSFFFAAVILLIDLNVQLGNWVPKFLQSKASVSRMLITTLIGGILTLSAYTLNSILVVLTTFSGQFSPRMLLNFVSDKRTQHVLGIFNGCFVYVLTLFIFITNYEDQTFVAIPLVTTIVALFAAVTFIYFINHATTWMQVHNISFNMQSISKQILNQSIKQEMSPYRSTDTLYHEQEAKKKPDHPEKIYTKQSGYIQLINFDQIIDQAQKDGIVVQLEASVGTFLLEGNPILSYWSGNGEPIDINQDLYLGMLEVGQKQTEIQDVEHGLNKLSEIAIKALGNNDPKTVSNVIHQLGELLLTISRMMNIPTYLVDNEKQLRLIIPGESFEFYLYKGYGYIRHYAEGNIQIITEILRVMNLLAKSVDSEHHTTLWEFACNTVYGFQSLHIYELDQHYLLETLKDLSETTGHKEKYESIREQIIEADQPTADPYKNQQKAAQYE